MLSILLVFSAWSHEDKESVCFEWCKKLPGIAGENVLASLIPKLQRNNVLGTKSNLHPMGSGTLQLNLVWIQKDGLHWMPWSIWLSGTTVVPISFIQVMYLVVNWNTFIAWMYVFRSLQGVRGAAYNTSYILKKNVCRLEYTWILWTNAYKNIFSCFLS